MSALLVASVVVGVVMWLQVRDHDRLEDSRREALTRAEQFALRMDAFDGSDIDGYVKSIEPMLTSKEKTSFTDQLKQFKEVYEQAAKAREESGKDGQNGAGEGKILLSGVTDVDEDSATVLIAHDTAVPGVAEAVHERWTVGMRKIDGSWLVDSFARVE